MITARKACSQHTETGVGGENPHMSRLIDRTDLDDWGKQMTRTAGELQKYCT